MASRSRINSIRRSTQTWNITQDRRGLIYVASNDGVLQYDGEQWERILTSSDTPTRSVAVDSLVYVGARSDFGYLRPDSVGTLEYHSLLDHVPEEERGFGDIWSTHTVGGDVYFQSRKYLFRWDGRKITTWTSRGEFHTSFVAGQSLYIRDTDQGLLRLEGNRLRKIIGKDYRRRKIY